MRVPAELHLGPLYDPENAQGEGVMDLRHQARRWAR